MAEVDFGGVRKDVCLAYLPEVAVHDYVIVHVGFAIQRLDERRALETLAEFRRFGLLDEEFADPFTAGDEGAATGAGASGAVPGDLPDQRQVARADDQHGDRPAGRSPELAGGRTDERAVNP
ncbi:HypC/HybG/HupF family hydrogenase formation chaperone [Frankia nepalensis]|uniref:HypC/HybG/HupF family hydrogenase formation chaperone n=1 Tax=Frankia nepalensis TaxID=1836974 RepID=UPI003898EA51